MKPTRLALAVVLVAMIVPAQASAQDLPEPVAGIVDCVLNHQTIGVDCTPRCPEGYQPDPNRPGYCVRTDGNETCSVPEYEPEAQPQCSIADPQCAFEPGGCPGPDGSGCHPGYVPDPDGSEHCVGVPAEQCPEGYEPADDRPGYCVRHSGNTTCYVPEGGGPEECVISDPQCAFEEGGCPPDCASGYTPAPDGSQHCVEESECVEHSNRPQHCRRRPHGRLRDSTP